MARIMVSILCLLITLSGSIFLNLLLISRYYSSSFGGLLSEIELKVEPGIVTDGFSAMYLQSSANTCAAAASTYLLAQFGDKVYESNFLDYFNGIVPPEGYSLSQIAEYLSSRGFVAKAFEGMIDDLPLPGEVPVIAHYKRKHFVVVIAATRDGVIVFDPATGSIVQLDRPLFSQEWSGKYLELRGTG